MRPLPDIDRLRQYLAGQPAEVPPAGDIPAAVLVGLVAGPEGWYLLLIRRTETPSHHPGEIAFPGGRLEPGESSAQAALREAEEELGIPPAGVDLLGALPLVRTRVSGYAVTPWVGVVGAGPAAGIVAEPGEVAAILEVPLALLADPAARREQRYIRGASLTVVPAFDVAGMTIWGATARIIDDLLEAIR